MTAEGTATRPRLSQEIGSGARSASELALELRRFHAAPPTEPGENLIDGFRSAAIAAFESDEASGEAVAELVRTEGELGPEDEEDLAAARTTHLLRLAVRRRLLPRRDGFLVEIRGLARHLREMLDVEQAKEDAREPDHLEQAVSPAAAAHFDFGALSKVIGPARGAIRLRPEETRRIREALSVLESFSFAPEEPVLRLVHDGSREPEALPGVHIETADDPIRAALDVFDRDSAGLVDVLRAARIARLVIDNAFDEARHGPWIDRFGPDTFRGEERQLQPVVVAIESIERLEENGLRSFSRLLLSGRPVHAVVNCSPQRSPQMSVGADARERLEPGYVAMGHRKAFAQQSSVGSPLHFLRGLFASLDHSRPALHVLDLAEGPEDARAAELALAGRAHPYFRYDPAAGSSWAGRLDFTGNPAPEAPWPVGTLECEREDGSTETLSVPVTFADCVLDDPARRGHFQPVPAGCPEDSLAPLSHWLELDEDEALAHVPWIWAIDPGNELRRVAVTRRLALVCRERADYWHTLQELAGVRNEYVTEAVQRARAESDVAAAAERDRLLADHAEQLAATKRTAVEEAMSHLARSLLALDSETPAIRAPAAEAAPAGAAPTVEAVEAKAEPVAAEPTAAEANGNEAEEELGEPWIDTPLCTSCNDCTDINPRLFVYDGNKQAVIGDSRAGTFAQVVRAAEKCPARCIHPGAPWNGEEAGLEDLVRRAKLFQ